MLHAVHAYNSGLYHTTTLLCKRHNVEWDLTLSGDQLTRETHQVSRKLGLYNERSLEPLQSLRDVRTILNSSALKSTGCPSRGARIGSQHHTTAHNQL